MYVTPTPYEYAFSSLTKVGITPSLWWRISDEDTEEREPECDTNITHLRHSLQVNTDVLY